MKKIKIKSNFFREVFVIDDTFYTFAPLKMTNNEEDIPTIKQKKKKQTRFQTSYVNR